MKKISTLLLALFSAQFLPAQNSVPPETGTFPYSAKDGNFPRAEPLREIDTPTVVKASDFGAIPDDGKCDRAALQKAIDTLKKRGNVKLLLEKGTYDIIEFGDRDRNSQALRIDGAENFVLDGNGAKILMHKPLNKFIYSHNCKNTIIRNLVLDNSIRPASFGKVVDTGKDSMNYVDVEIFDGYPTPDEEMFTSTAKSSFCYFLDEKNPPRHAPGTYGNYSVGKVKHLEARKYRIYISNRGDKQMAKTKAGMLWRNSARNGNNAVSIYAAENFTCQNIIINSSNAGAFAGSRCLNLNFLNCRIEPAAGEIFSTNADGFHMANNRNGVWMEKCYVKGVGDDTMNTYKLGIFLHERLGARTFKTGVKVRNNEPPRKTPSDMFENGDDVVLFTGGDGKIIFRAKVAEFDKKTGAITLDKDVPEIPLGFDKMKSTTIYNVSRGKGTVILDCVFEDNFRYGVFLKTSNVLIENCKFIAQSAEAIAAFNEAGWPEGFLAENVTIRDTLFKDCGFYGSYEESPKAATIVFACEHQKQPPAQRKNIWLENNIIEGWNKAALRIMYADNVTLKNNTIGKPSPRSPNKDNPVIIVK